MQPYRHSIAKFNFSLISVGLSALLLAALSNSDTLAQPLLSVTLAGQNDDGNPTWRVDVTPDASLFTNGEGSLAAEIGFTLSEDSTFLDATVNESVWAFESPGSNPFTGTNTFGLSLDSNQAFVSFGSDPVSETVELLTFTTMGITGSLEWGGYTIDSGLVGEFTGARIAQDGINFDNIIGGASFVVINPNDCNIDGVVDAEDLQCACGSDVIDKVLELTGLIRGDLDGNGTVEFADFLVMSTNFGAMDAGYAGGDVDCDGTVAFADFLEISANFGNSSAGIATVPEPGNGVFFAPFGVALLLLRRSRKN